MLDLGMRYDHTEVVAAPDSEDVQTLARSNNGGIVYRLVALANFPWNGPRLAVFTREDALPPVSEEEVNRVRQAENARRVPTILLPPNSPPVAMLFCLLGDTVPAAVLCDGKRWTYRHGHAAHCRFTAFYRLDEPAA